MSADVDDEFDELVANEGGHRVLIGQEQLTEHGPHLQLVFADETNPLPIDDVLHRYNMVMNSTNRSQLTVEFERYPS